jgi:hypothetical protein
MSTLKAAAITNLAGETAYQPTLGTAQASTSGTAILFTGIPSWVKRVTVMFKGVSLSSTSALLVQIGSGSVTSSGYASSSGYTSGTGLNTIGSTAGYPIATNADAASLVSGNLIISLFGGNTWIASGTFKLNSSSTSSWCGGDVTLAGALDRVNITSLSGTDTFDNGSVNILYE